MRYAEAKTKNILPASFLFTLALFFLLKTYADPDIWGHIRFGQDIYQACAVPTHDTYSYSAYGARWINHECLSELVFYMIFKYAGGRGLVIFKSLLFFIIILILSRALKRDTKSVFLQILFITVALSVVAYGNTVKPHLFTYLSFTCLIVLLDGFERSRDPKYLYPVPLIFLFWCNMHGGFVIGTGLLLLYFVFAAFRRSVTRELAFATALSILAVSINPYGIGLWRFLISAVTMKRPFITEWQAVDFVFEARNYFLIAAIVLIGFLFSRRKRGMYEAVALAAALYFSFRYNRHIVLFAIMAAIYVPKHIDSFAGSWFNRLEAQFSKYFFNGVYLVFRYSLLWVHFLVSRPAPSRYRYRQMNIRSMP